MLRRYGSLNYDHLLVSDSETESDDLSVYVNVQDQKQNNKGKNIKKESSKNKKNKKGKTTDEESRRDNKALKKISDTIIKKAEKYQEYMKQIPIPPAHESSITFNTWQDLAKSMKQMYEQPLHYLTHILLKQWDESRIGTKDEDKPLDKIIHHSKAESTIWVAEEFHRHCSSHKHVAKLWLADPTYRNFVDPNIL